MKYTIFTLAECSFQLAEHFATVLDNANILAEQGHNINLIYCDGNSHHTCCLNMSSNKLICKICMMYKKILFKRLSSSISLIPSSDYKKNIMAHEKHHLTTIDQLKQIEYRGVKIGLCALSTYISTSRNLNPKFNDDFSNYMNTLLELSQDYTDMAIAIIEDTKPDIVAAFNARIIHSRPVIETAKNMNIPHLSYEMVYDTQGQRRKISFKTTPHDVEENNALINQIWDSTIVSQDKKIDKANQFFFKRKNSIPSGDKLYVKDQISGQLPKEWEAEKHNILILNSSEDEGAAISDESTNKPLFSSQLLAIRYIAEHYKDKEELHFYLRIHPNLKNVKYSYHTDLYKLSNKYPNFTVIPADSSISTYALIDNCDKVIVFGSTTGPEAVYWGRPTLLLTYCIYSLLDICFIPKDLKQLDEYILNKKLPPKDRNQALKYGYYRLNDECEEFKYYQSHKKNINFLGKHFEVCVFHLNWLDKILLACMQIIGKRLYYKKLRYPTQENVE